MSETAVMSCVAGAVQLVVAAYALRLNRLFGARQVGWSLFAAFALLALLHLGESTGVLGNGLQINVQVDIIYVFISLLLLTGLVHMETLLKERLRLETLERELRAQLEQEVKTKTAHLTRAIDELMAEIEERKKIQAQFVSWHDPVA